jgi:guanine nucleotide-binding protein G(I)/G(S)/G(T) subunit beta-1
MSNDMNADQMQAKIAAARREAEGLKDRIKRKKDDLADTSCMLIDR